MNFCTMVLFHFIENYVKCDRILEESVVLDRRKFVSLHLGHLVWGKPGQITSHCHFAEKQRSSNSKSVTWYYLHQKQDNILHNSVRSIP